MQISKTDSLSTSTITPKIILANDHDDNITEIPIEFFKSKPKRLTSTDILHYLTQNFSKEKEIMLKLFNLEDLKQAKDVVLISLIISSLSNFIKPETSPNPAPLPPAFEIVKVTQIQSNNHFEANASTTPNNFSHATDTDFEINADEFGNIWIRNIFIDSEKNAVASNWHVYSMTGEHLAEFDNAGFKAETYRGKVWDTIEKSFPGVIGGIAGYYTKEKIDKLEAEIKELRKEHEAKLEKKESEIKDLRKEYEVKIEKKDETWAKQLSDKESLWVKQMSDKESLWVKQISDKEILWANQMSEKNKEIKDLQFKIFDLLSKDK